MVEEMAFSPGDTVRVYQKVIEGDPSAHSASSGQVKTRLQAFEGVVLSIRGRGENKTFTVRKVVGNVAVERIWPVASPMIEKIEVKAHPKKRVRRAKLYYLRHVKRGL